MQVTVIEREPLPAPHDSLVRVLVDRTRRAMDSALASQHPSVRARPLSDVEKEILSGTSEYSLPDRSVTCPGKETAPDAVLGAFDEQIGLERLVRIHLNDSKAERGSRIDRHEHVGAGRLRQRFQRGRQLKAGSQQTERERDLTGNERAAAAGLAITSSRVAVRATNANKRRRSRR